MSFALCVGVAGCGGGRGIPPDSAAALVRNLDTVERGVRQGECERTRATLEQLVQQARSLPSDVDRDVRSTLDTGVQNLASLFAAECEQKPKPVPEPTPEPEPVPEPEPKPVPEPEPEPVPEPEPEPEPVPEPEPEPEPEPTPEQEPEEPEKPEKPKVRKPDKPR